MKILAIDIETAPNVAHAWGLRKQNIAINQIVEDSYTLCFAYRWVGQKQLHFVRDNVAEAARELLDEADVALHYNGNSFDIPVINKDILLAGLHPPAPFHNIDLYRVVRNRFRFPSYKLDYVASVLGLGNKVKHEGHDLWTACMAGDEKAWKRMERYNKQDVALLEKLYKRLLPWIKGHPNHALYMVKDKPVCPNCGSEKVKKNGVEHTKLLTYQRYKCNSCGAPLRGRSAINSKAHREHILKHGG